MMIGRRPRYGGGTDGRRWAWLVVAALVSRTAIANAQITVAKDDIVVLGHGMVVPSAGPAPCIPDGYRLAVIGEVGTAAEGEVVARLVLKQPLRYVAIVNRPARDV